VYHQYVVREPGEQREALRRHLAERGIDTEVYYPLGLHQQPCFAALGYRDGDLPETERAARETLALPLYAEISEAQQEHVIARVVEFFEA
jgi:dTDP-4-amino-4,6-dideoxygalactose transaminase